MSPTKTIEVYLKVLNGSSWPRGFITSSNSKRILTEILQYLMDINGVDNYEDAKTLLTEDFIHEMKLTLLCKKYPKPPELLPEENLHLLWLLYPQKTMTEYELLIKVVDDVIEGKRPFFPNKYFIGTDKAEDRAVVAFVHLCEDVLKLSDEEIKKTFGNSYGMNVLQKYNLRALATTAFSSMKKLFQETYPWLCDKKEEKK